KQILSAPFSPGVGAVLNESKAIFKVGDSLLKARDFPTSECGSGAELFQSIFCQREVSGCDVMHAAVRSAGATVSLVALDPLVQLAGDQLWRVASVMYQGLQVLAD